MLAVAMLAGATVAATTFAPAAPASAAPLPAAPGVPDSAQLTGAPVATGVVRDGAGALVLLYAAPEKHDLIAPIAQARADASGRWTLRLPAGADLTADLVPDETAPDVNFEVRAVTAGGADEWQFAAPTLPAGPAAAGARVVTARADGRALRLDGRAGADITLQAGRMAAVRADPDDDGGVAPGGCVRHVLATYPDRQVTVGSAHSASTPQRTQFTYARGTSSYLGVGISTSGDYGTFSGGSSQSSGVNVTQVYPVAVGKGADRYVSRFTYEKIREDCLNGAGIWSFTWKVEPKSFDGGAEVFGGTRVDFGNCRPYDSGSTYILDHNTAHEYEAGVDMGVVGVSLSARSGWSENTSLTISVSTDSWICGSDGPPGNYPHAVQVRAQFTCPHCTDDADRAAR